MEFRARFSQAHGIVIGVNLGHGIVPILKFNDWEEFSSFIDALVGFYTECAPPEVDNTEIPIPEIFLRAWDNEDTINSG